MRTVTIEKDEIWKDVPEFEGKYKISNMGRVFSMITSKIMKYDNVAGYNQVTFYNGKYKKRYKVHRLVMLAFIGNSDLQVNHINGIKSDNRLSNLEYVTQSENMKHAYKIGLEKPCDNGFKKSVRVIKNSEEITFVSIREMCRIMNFDRRTVLRHISGSSSYRTIKGYKIEVI